MKDDLIIPVYLNQRLVFDLVAMLQDGIATVTRISETNPTTAQGVCSPGSKGFMAEIAYSGRRTFTGS